MARKNLSAGKGRGHEKAAGERTDSERSNAKTSQSTSSGRSSAWQADENSEDGEGKGTGFK